MAARKPPDDGRLDWSRSWGGGDRQPCTICHQPTWLRHPFTGKWTHKVCAEGEYANPEGTR